jgi:hypothetical protein
LKLDDIQRGERMVDNSDRSHLDPDKVRKVELFHQPPGRVRVRVTIEYVNSEVRVLTVHKAVLATVLEELYSAESKR